MQERGDDAAVRRILLDKAVCAVAVCIRYEEIAEEDAVVVR